MGSGFRLRLRGDFRLAAPGRDRSPSGRNPERRRRARAGGLGVALFVLAVGPGLAACSADREATPDAAPIVSAGPASALPAGVTVQLVQLRSDVASRQAQVELRNGTGDDLMIGAVSVSDPRFAGPATRVIDRVSFVRAGGTVDVRVQLPPMNCDAIDDGEGTVHLDDVRVASEGSDGAADAPRQRVVAPIDDPLGFLAPLHRRECLAQAVADAASLTFAAFTPSPAGEPADLVLEIEPTGEGAVRVGALQRTNLLTPAAGLGSIDETFPIGLDVAEGDSRPIIVHLPLVPFRCDPHAVQEDKRGTIFTLEVELDGRPGEIELAAAADMRGRILTWVAQWCGFGSR